jgi:DNA-binding NtrC family response regulator
MPNGSGLDFLQEIKQKLPNVPVIIMTAFSDLESAVAAFQGGAFEYLAKPFDVDQAIDIIRRAVDESTRQTNEEELPQETPEIIGQAPAMQEVFRAIGRLSRSHATVLINGESGTGKELVARALHFNGARKLQPFVAVNCSAIPETLLESELFGHVKGSFTGAIQTKVGLFKVADGGTLFLDEVSNISLSTQAKLLRALQERQITPIGGTQPMPIGIHLVAATNRNLKTMVAEGRFREDLFFRLNIIPIELPPLRERKGDIPLLISHFLKKFTSEIGKDIRGVAPDAMLFLEGYSYPGNVRELENIIERAVVLAEDTIIRKVDLEQRDAVGGEDAFAGRVPVTAEELKEMKRNIRGHAVDAIEKAFLVSALERNNWNVTRAAEETGILRPNFQGMLKRLGISIKAQLER